MHFAIFIINSHGSLVYDNTALSDKIKIKSNDALRLAGTFHTMHSISSQITPESAEEEKFIAGTHLRDGIQTIESDSFKLHCYQVLTGIKFLLVSDVSTPETEMHHMLAEVYQIYGDFVSKNPFYEQDMPIRMTKFDKAIEKLFMPSYY
ncbi:unnamed protein product [Moneuplotes crassus]|uniref:Trafficking protein particle complex subunit n=1 Tax=Euplotes crassus TaxID=5936 RepID=A0AAD1Y2I9_EUPCR|nr:unnamed protein product [Moneuplotes crassus]